MSEETVVEKLSQQQVSRLLDGREAEWSGSKSFKVCVRRAEAFPLDTDELHPTNQQLGARAEEKLSYSPGVRKRHLSEVPVRIVSRQTMWAEIVSNFSTY